MQSRSMQWSICWLLSKLCKTIDVKSNLTELHTGWGKKTQKLKDYSKQVKASAKELKINT